MSSQGSGGQDRHPLRVVECGSGVSAAYATKLLADVGAEVIKVEPPDGDATRERGPFPGDRPDPEKSGLFVYLNTNKRATVADLTTPAGQEHLAALLADADVLVHNVAPAERSASGLDSGELCRRFPRLVVTSISMFGDYGPRAQWRGYELTASNAGGWAFLSPGASPSPELPPLKPFGAQCDFHAAAYAAFTSLAAYRHQLSNGHGPGDRRVRAGGRRRDARDEPHALDATPGGRPRGSVLGRWGRGSSPTASTARSSRWRSRRSSGSGSSSSWATRTGPARRSSRTDWSAGRTWTS